MSPSANTFTGSVQALSFAAIFAAVSAVAIQPGAVQSASIGTEPLYFEAHGAKSFVARGQDCSVYVGPTEAVLLFSESSTEQLPVAHSLSEIGKSAREARAVQMSLIGANADGKMSGVQQLAGKANYLIGSNPADWRTGVPLFGKVQVNEVYPGVNVIYYADQSAHLEYDFVLQPNASPDQIRFRIKGADSVSINANGDLVLKIGSEEIRQHRPVIYQNVNDGRKVVVGGYRLTAANTVGFRIGAYDHSLPLVIDPVLSFSTYIGGSKADIGRAVAVDDTLNVYVAGDTLSKGLVPTNFTTLNFSGTNYLGGIGAFGDAFVAKYDANHDLVYLTYFGGKTDDAAWALAVTNGNAIITGFTDSDNFPIVPTHNSLATNTIAHRGQNFNGPRVYPVNAFVAELDPTGSSLIFSTLIGGSRRETGSGIALDDSGIYITGFTESTNFPVLPSNVFTNYQPRFGGGQDGFISKIDWTGTTLLYSTFFGGTNVDFPQGIAVNNQEPYVTGYTASTNFPILNPIQITNDVWTNGRTLNVLNMQSNRSVRLDAFVVHFASDFTLKYSTYLGGTNDDSGAAIAVDSAGNAYVTGYTYSRVFPTNAAVEPRSTGSNYTSHVFLTKLAPEGSNVIYSVDFGSRSADRGTGIALADNDQVYLTGTTTWTNMFATNSYADLRSTNALVRRGTSGLEAFVTGVQQTSGGIPLQFTNSLLFGGIANDQPNGIAVRTVGTNVAVWIAGQTFSRDFVVTNDVNPSLVQTNLGGVKKGKLADAFVSEFLFPVVP